MTSVILEAAASLLAVAVVMLWNRLASANTAKTSFEKQVGELSTSIAAMRNELEKTQLESARRAGFEALASEREKIIAQQSSECKQLQANLNTKTEEASESATKVAELNAVLAAERRILPEKLELLKAAQGNFSDHFRTLAGDVLKGERQTLSDTNSTQIGAILNPLQEKINEFRAKVEQAQNDSNTGVARLQGLISNLNSMNQQLTEEAHNLTTALRGSSKAQGDWGEFILRDLLEKAGLREGEQYTFQQRFAEVDDENSTQVSITDVVLHLPGGRHLIIDSKVSLNAYADSVNVLGEDEREQAIRRHVVSVRAHVRELAAKSYQEISSLETLGFIVMFVPIEPAFFAAIKGDDSLWSDAYHQRVLLVGPSTLLFVIRMVHELWDQEKKAENYKEILDRGTKLYDKFVAFLADLDSIGGGLQVAVRAFEGARSKLTESDTSLVRQVERLRELGVSPKVKKKGKKATQAVIPKPWLEDTFADTEGLVLAASSENEEEGEETEELEGGNTQVLLNGE